MSDLPSIRALDPERCLILGYADTIRFLEAYLGGRNTEERKSPAISPAYNKQLGNLPPAIFIIGSEDGTIDDTLLMACKWQLAGNDAVVKFIPGACHGFMTFDGSKVACTRQGWDVMLQYIKAKI